MTRRPAPFVVAVVVTAALALTACGALGGESTEGSSTSATSASASTAGSPTSKASSSDADVIDGPHEEQVTVKEAKDALPGVGSLPDGFKNRSAGTIDSGSRAEQEKTDPGECAALLFASSEHADYANAHRTAGAFTRLSIPDGDGGVTGDVNVAVNSYDEPYPLELFDTAGEAIGTCAEFNSGSTDNKATSIAAPLLGDRTFAVRIEYPVIGQSLDYIYVRSGHNLVRIIVRSVPEEYDSALLEDLAGETLDNLEAAS